MITSPAPPHILDKLRRLAGPNPEGSKLTDIERLHLIYQLGAIAKASEEGAVVWAVVQQLHVQLNERGLTNTELVAVCDRVGTDPVLRADAIAVHPSLHDLYLD